MNSLMNFFVTSLLIIYTSKITSGQTVLDAPFIMEKEHLFEPQPESLNWTILDYSRELSDSQIKSKMIYPSSFLYAQPKYTRTRVMRYVPFQTNESFGDSIDHIHYSIDSTGIWYGIDEKKNQRSNKNILHREDLNLHLRKRVEELDGIDTNGFNALPSYSVQAITLFTNSSLIPTINPSEDGMVDSNGIFRIPKNYYPQDFEIIPFVKMIKRIILKGKCSAYMDSAFTKALSLEKVKILLNGENPLKINGLRLKEDYYINPITGKLTSAIIGLGLVGEDSNPGKEILWVYFPELYYGMEDCCTFYDGKVINYNYLLEFHLFNERIETMVNIGSTRPSEIYELDNTFAVKLEALVNTSIRLEHLTQKGEKFINDTLKFAADGALLACEFSIVNGNPDGGITLFYPNNTMYLEGSMQEGVCMGEFNYYYPSGKAKATRNFNSNQLQGIQLNYWPNEQVYAKYDFAADEILSLSRYYEDGEMLEQGNFKEGIQNGIWEYQLRCEPDIAKNIINVKYESMEPHYNGIDAYSYKVNYIQSKEDGCYIMCLTTEILE